MNETEKLTEKRFRELPVNLQKALTNVKWKDIVKNIATENNLDLNESRTLEIEVLFLLYNFEPYEKFYDNLRNEVGLDEERTGVVFKSISKNVIDVLDEEIQKLEATNHKIELQPITISSENSDKPQLANLPNYSDYEKGSDPYREPVE